MSAEELIRLIFNAMAWVELRRDVETGKYWLCIDGSAWLAPEAGARLVTILEAA